MPDLSGQSFGRYHLTEQLGEGGMATVYRAYDTRLEREVAVKVIRSGAFPPDILHDVLRRFEREAKALAKLSHPNIVKVHDFGEYNDAPFLVMEYLPGGTLKKLLGKPLPWQDALKLLLPVARGVAYAHQRGILHRDIKPANILITETGEPLLSDFGIAKIFEGEQTTALTGSGMAIGTPEYMAPEQWAGKSTQQSDVYSLGVVLYEMVTGRKPYIADTPAAILLKQALEPLPRPRQFAPDLPDDVERLLFKALARALDDRFIDAPALVTVIENLLDGHAVLQPATPTPVAVDVPPVQLTPGTLIEARFSSETAVQLQDGGETILPEVEKIENIPTSEEAKSDSLAPTTRPSNRLPRLAVIGLVALFGMAGLVWIREKISPNILAEQGASTSRVTASSTLTATATITHTATSVATDTSTPILTLPATVSFTSTVTALPTEFIDEQGVPMRLVQAGEFTMGANSSDLVQECQKTAYTGYCQPDFFKNQEPPHNVYLDNFFIDTFEVTNALYRTCVDSGACQPPTKNQNYALYRYFGESKYDDYPVIYVNWEMAQTYCKWRGARLPTEAEWEKAARGNDGRLYPWGSGLDCSHANYWLGDNTRGCIGDTTKVGSYENGKSPYGVYDMAGNVEEWTSDLYKAYPGGDTNGSFSNGEADYHVLRGGSWISGWIYPEVMSVERYASQATGSEATIGFRCARSADLTPTPQLAIEPTPTLTLVAAGFSTGITDKKGVSMRLIPSGEFTMGNNNGSPDEKPAHTITLDTFYMDEHEVTNALFKACVEAGNCAKPYWDLSGGKNQYGLAKFDHFPVTGVTWNDAQNYCAWRGARLPTEAEWEKAARGGLDGKLYPWGDDAPICQMAAINGALSNACVPKIADVVAVGSFQPNRYGLFDMAGNVAEWVSDWFGPSYYQNSIASNPHGPTSGTYRTIRGGSIADMIANITVSNRSYEDPSYRRYDVGFRCVLSK